MKIIAFLIILPFLTADNNLKGLRISPEIISLAIDKNMSDTRLKNIKFELWDQAGITFDVENIRRSATGQIEFIAISVDCHDGFNGKAEKTFMKGKTRFGFYRDYRPDMTAFMIGDIPKRDPKRKKH